MGLGLEAAIAVAAKREETRLRFACGWIVNVKVRPPHDIERL
jgi:hypothetical protein